MQRLDGERDGVHLLHELPAEWRHQPAPEPVMKTRHFDVALRAEAAMRVPRGPGSTFSGCFVW